MPLIALALALLPPAAAAQASVGDLLTALAERLVAATVTDDPIVASSLGLSAADGRLAIPSEAARAAKIVRLNGWKAELEAIARSAGGGLGLVDGNNVKLLRAEFDSELNELVARESDRKNYARPALRLVAATTPASDGARGEQTLRSPFGNSPSVRGLRPKSRPQHND